MVRKRFLSQKEINYLLNNSDDEDAACDNSDKIVWNKNTKIIYIPPSNVNAPSDEEMIDDEDLVTDIEPNLEIAGEIEAEYDSQTFELGAPPLQENIEVAKPLQPQPSSSTTSNNQYCTTFNQQKRYSTEASFGEPSWKKTKRFNFQFDTPDEDLVEPLKIKIVEEMGKYI